MPRVLKSLSWSNHLLRRRAASPVYRGRAKGVKIIASIWPNCYYSLLGIHSLWNMGTDLFNTFSVWLGGIVRSERYNLIGRGGGCLRLYDIVWYTKHSNRPSRWKNGGGVLLLTRSRARKERKAMLWMNEWIDGWRQNLRKVATNDFNVKTKQLWINQQFGTNVLRGEDWSLEHWGAIICQAKLHAG